MNKPLIYGILAGFGIFLFYIAVLTIFVNFSFAFSEFKKLWFFILPLAGGFGTQIGLYTSIKHSAMVNTGATASGTVSGGSMVVCCSHFLLNIIPIIGLSGLATFLMAYQKLFFSVGIASSVFGVGFMLHHKRKMEGDLGYIKINAKMIIYGLLIVFVLLLLLINFGIIGSNFGKSAITNSGEKNYNDFPEKCRPPAGQDINSWKEHLSHHEETQECLNYFSIKK